MSVVQLLDGSQHIIFDNKDLINIAYDKLGYEYSNELEQIVNFSTEAEIYAEKRFNSDMDAYEGQIEEYRDCMLEVMEIAEKLLNYTHESKRFEKKKAIKELELIVKKLNTEL